MGDHNRYLVYNLRKRGGDSADKYFKSTELVAGVKDMRFQALMPDVLHWLGIRKIDNMVSMSDMYVHPFYCFRASSLINPNWKWDVCFIHVGNTMRSWRAGYLSLDDTISRIILFLLIHVWRSMRRSLLVISRRGRKLPRKT
jgi:hypothetical protein